MFFLINRLQWLLAVCVAIFGVEVIHGAETKYRIDMNVDRENGIYRCGEIVTYTVSVFRDGQPVDAGEIMFQVKTWLGVCVHEQKTAYTGKPLQFRFTYDKPAFVLAKAIYCGVDGKEIKHPYGVGVGFDPEKLESAAKMPQDFDDFWENARKERDAVPMDLRLTPCQEVSTPEVEVFKISVANVNNTRAYGYLNIPKKAKPPFPVSVHVPGAGPGLVEPGGGVWTARRGILILEVTVHAYDISPFDGEPVDIKKVYSPDYSRQGAPDKKKYYFYKAILGIDRLIGYVASRPDVDRTRFTIGGTSQGGALALILGGMNNDKFTEIWSNVPGMCDHTAYRLDRETSWPELIPPEIRKDTAREECYREFSEYFDAVNFARKIRCPTIIGAGLADDCCKPANIYSAYNVIQVPKRIATGPKTIHPGMPPMMPKLQDAEWREFVRKAGEEITRKLPGTNDTGKGEEK